MRYETTVKGLWDWLADEEVRTYYHVGRIMHNLGQELSGYSLGFFGEADCTLTVECEGKQVVGVEGYFLGMKRNSRGVLPPPQHFWVYAKEAGVVAVAESEQVITVSTPE